MNVLDSFSLKDKVAVVTGGAGGYGRQIVAALAEAGARTFTASRNLAALEELATRERERGLDVSALTLDLADEQSILALRDSVCERAGGIDVLVNNSVLRSMKSWQDPVEAWVRSMDTNATGLFLITRAFGDVMAEAGRGSIINIGSIYGVVGPDYSLYEELGSDPSKKLMGGRNPDYYFHKGGMANFTRYVAAYYGPRGVRCNLISPGGLYRGQPEEFVARYAKRTFLGRMAGEKDLEGAVVFLASDASAYVTGANLMVDGGLTAK